ncbi:MAG: methyltransferase [Naasia sp.]
MLRSDFSLDALTRAPDVEGPELVAVDATDRLVLDTAADRLTDAGAGEVVVLGDRHGALALGAWGLHGASRVRVHQDALLGERALAANAATVGAADDIVSLPLGSDLLDGARVVLLQLPRSLAELDEWAQAIARFAARDVVVVAGGRIKHMSLGMNDVLRRSFERLDIGHARQKSRVLVAADPRADLVPDEFPAVADLRADELPGGGIRISAHGGVFAGASLDIGTRALLSHLHQLPETGDVIDLGSGSGVIAVAAALARPGLRLVAIDQSAAAVASTRATAAANGLDDRIDAVREDGLVERPDASADLILCNPPFHSGSAVSDDLAERMLRDAGRVLRPGGEVWTVFNSHLRYRPMLDRVVGPTAELSRTPKFTVTRSTRR